MHSKRQVDIPGLYNTKFSTESIYEFRDNGFKHGLVNFSYNYYRDRKTQNLTQICVKLMLSNACG